MRRPSSTSTTSPRLPAAPADVVRIEYAIEVPASRQRVFDAVVDWDHQGEWMLGTKVQATGPGAGGLLGRDVGGELSAFTGSGPIGFLDTMRITNWDEPHRVDVLHTGRFVRGTGTMVVESVTEDRSRFVWSEELELPLGILGRIGWPVVRPLFGAGIKFSLRKFAAFAAR